MYAKLTLSAELSSIKVKQNSTVPLTSAFLEQG